MECTDDISFRGFTLCKSVEEPKGKESLGMDWGKVRFEDANRE